MKNLCSLHYVITLKVMFEQHMCRTKTDDKNIKKAFVIWPDWICYLAGLYQVTVNYSHKARCYMQDGTN